MAAIAINRMTRVRTCANLLAMRTTYSDATVRLYHLSDGPEGGSADTLFYGPLERALAIAATQTEEVQAGLFLATDNDVVAYLDLAAE